MKKTHAQFEWRKQICGTRHVYVQKEQDAVAQNKERKKKKVLNFQWIHFFPLNGTLGKRHECKLITLCLHNVI